jgi:AraC-like DNA-binding protein
MAENTNIQYTVYNEKLMDKVRFGRDMTWMPLALERTMFWLRLADEHVWPRGYWLKHYNSRQLSVQLILEGCMSVTVAGREHIVPAGTAAVIPAGNCCLAAGGGQPCRKLYFIPSGNMFEAAVHRLMFDRLSLIRDFDTPLFRNMYDELFRLADEKKPETIARYSALSYELVMYTANLLSRSAMPQQLSDCLDFIRGHIAEKLSLDRLAAVAHVNKTALKELFARYMKESPGRYITGTRLNYAKTLLDDSSFSIKMIADLCGYESPFYFSNAFRKEFGISPREYRKGSALQGKSTK